MDDHEYKIALDDQVSKFLDIRHKHTYFLITAAIVVLAFVLNFAASNNLLTEVGTFALVLIAVGTLSSLSVAGAALWSLALDNASHMLHLRYRHQSKSWDDIPETARKDWDTINRRASILRNASFVLLTISVFTNAMFLAQQLHSKGARTVHHYGEDSTEIIPHDDHFEIIFTNKETGQKTRMTIQRVGSREDPSKGLTIADVKSLSDEVNDVLRRKLK